MIKASELRIGNVFYTASGIETVRELSEDGIAYAFSWDGVSSDFGPEGSTNEMTRRRFVYPYDKAEPIPLTPDILEKCGFEKRLEYWEPFVGDAKGAWYRRGDLFVVILKSNGKIFRSLATNGDEFGYVDGPALISLHELQNLIFALTREELTINL